MLDPSLIRAGSIAMLQLAGSPDARIRSLAGLLGYEAACVHTGKELTLNEFEALVESSDSQLLPFIQRYTCVISSPEELRELQYFLLVGLASALAGTLDSFEQELFGEVQNAETQH